MSVAFPVFMPIGGDGRTLIESYNLSLVNKVGVSESPFSFAQQIQDYGADRWEGTITTRPLYGEDARNMRGFLNSIQGRRGTFQFAIPQSLSNHYELNGTFSTQNHIHIRPKTGITPDHSLTRGTYFSLGSAGSRRLFMMSEDYSGNITDEHNISPRANYISYSTGEDLITTNPIGTFRLMDNNTGFSVDITEGHRISFSFHSV